MNPPTILPLREWRLPEILFVLAACFAIGASGFFLAVYLQLRSTTTSYRVIPDTAKEKIAQQSFDRGDGTVTEAAPVAQPNQVDEKDPRAAAKLKVMEQPIQR